MDKQNECPIDWNKYIEECESMYFLKREVKRLMRINDAFEFRAQLSYSFGYGDATAGLDFDGEFCIDDIHLEQDDDTQWTAQENDQPDEDYEHD